MTLLNILRVFAFLWLAFSSGAAAGGVGLESGLKPVLNEVLVDNVAEQKWLRFRFTAAQIDPSVEDALRFDEIEEDMARLCTHLALPYMEKHGLTADRIVISVADRFVVHGTTDPAATQFFEQFRPGDGVCVGEGF
jgi:hypothetical protein